MSREGVNWSGPATPSVVITVTECCYPSGWYYEGNDGSAGGWEPSASDVTLTATSPKGCDTQIVTKTAKSDVFKTVVYRFNLKLYWCWDYPKITKLGITCYASDVDSFTWRYSGCTTTGYYYTWRGHPKGGRYQMAQAKFSNCVFKYGCWKENVDTLEIWVNGNGAWTKKTS